MGDCIIGQSNSAIGANIFIQKKYQDNKTSVKYQT
jgi:hypothetical protein